MTEQQALDALLRMNLSAFVEKCFSEVEQGQSYAHNWHVDAIAHQLTRVRAGEVRRLIVNIPPRHLKSLTVTIAYTAWLLGHDPTKKIICVSHSHDLAREHANLFLKIVESPWYRRLFPKLEIAKRGHRAAELKTTNGGYRLATSVGGSVLGRGADLIIVDDPIQPPDVLSQAERKRVETFFDQTLLGRLNNKKTGAIIIVMQRLHESDLVAHVQQGGDWELLSIPAIADRSITYQLGPRPAEVYSRPAGEILFEAREPRSTLDEIRRGMGTRGFQAQYQQEPVPLEGSIIKRDWLRYYGDLPEEFDRIVASWDTASTVGSESDYSVGTLWGLVRNEYFLIDLVRGQFEFPALRRQVIDLHHQYPGTVTVIEDTEMGRALTSDLRDQHDLRPILDKPRFEKDARMEAQSARFEAGEVLMPRNAPWLEAYLAELLAFPGSRHDDQIDSTSQALRYLTRRRGQLHLTRPPARPRPLGNQRPQGFARS